MQIDQASFEKIVAEAIDGLPEKFLKRMHNVAILVEDFPTTEQRKSLRIRDKYGLLGLFEGYHQSSRQNFGPVLPDRITLFRVPIMQSCSTPDECRAQITDTLKHEIAHHFGSDEKGARKAGKR
ncbi:hypothetical protein A2303_07555 [Candidatus Falkowbacteria bacterium RIFOXYB2_FULL_47_14]|uniref:Metallopeptidase family protein n=1 Tax=Candidatus Falkowbacteria bacterium RIFOXYA2_FULL_47_19 TaxID=1797994 RepID=A0A1F5SGM7_9BACT|nr:MAG: hypothetical protein A2227_01305 [Candidatus Falkowbacteria bacterium RIFOXYA2_FULL_47_19]OGF34999.1 MAG: hypothetical protein A2468_07260 [Candidatus Falkowbacteria bacterium RIFOXYC2_FULL_46_15]OGF43715.1 MAG: hypothetical protein A2303_07555 [Candidatus Falkowbacteria bacterium RIFOXYB2_FULL_47_14]